MKKKQIITASFLAGAIAMGITAAQPAHVFAATAHYNDSTVTGAGSGWSAWAAAWDKTAADYTKVSITPGADETKLNFAWYSRQDQNPTPVVLFGTSKNNLKVFKGTAGTVDSSLTGGVRYQYNHVTVSGLKENTSYVYSVRNDGKDSEVRSYKTGSFENVNILYVGDPQIGASKGQTAASGETLVNTDGAANTAARNDGFAWSRTLNTAVGLNPDLNFIISAGDQINKTGKPKEEEYASYLSPSILSGLAEATTIGNHDSLNPDYGYHFYDPNQTGYGKTQAGGDYYYSYGPALFIVLNTNNYNAAEHEKTLQQAVASDPGAKWRIVTIHQDIYGSGLDHSDTDGMILRTQLTPLFDKYDVDVVLQGHDHTYSRSKLLYGDQQAHSNYEFRLAADGSDYDWDHAFNRDTSEAIPLYPEDSDAAGKTALQKFSDDNRCYTIENAGSSSVTDPKGVLYMTANSASGSKFYELISTQQDYIAKRSQNWLPSYSVINLTGSTFTINTYEITDNGVEKIDDAFTITKTK
jgi:hypothetical protein